MTTMVSCKFLDCNVNKGCSPAFRDKVLAADGALRARFAREGNGMLWRDWHNVRSIRGYYDGGPHKVGEAFDLNYSTNGYGVTRAGSRLGGEAQGAKLKGVREAAMAAFDGIMQAATGAPADLHGWRKGENIVEVFRRFERVNAETKRALGLYFRSGTNHTEIRRRPVNGYLTAPREAFAGMVASGELIAPLDTVPVEILRAYEAIRIPLVMGNPAYSPEKTRNPANGFMDLREVVVEELCRVGLRWGVQLGAAENGDYMHFDSRARLAS